jgi:DNA-binding Lrp family transcriptional regulator
LLAALRSDGRVTLAELATVTGMSEPTVRRRVNQLRGGGVLYLDVDLDSAVLGFHTQAVLWMSVRPSQLVGVAEAVALHPEVALVAATTGPTNLLAKVVCRDVDALYGYLAERVGAIDAIERVETAPVIRTLKRAATSPFRAQ